MTEVEQLLNQRKGKEALVEVEKCLAYDADLDFIMPKLYVFKCKAHNKVRRTTRALSYECVVNMFCIIGEGGQCRT